MANPFDALGALITDLQSAIVTLTERITALEQRNVSLTDWEVTWSDWAVCNAGDPPTGQAITAPVGKVPLGGGVWLYRPNALDPSNVGTAHIVADRPWCSTSDDGVPDGWTGTVVPDVEGGLDVSVRVYVVSAKVA